MTAEILAPAARPCIYPSDAAGDCADASENPTMPTENGRFTSTEFRAALERNGETQSSFADFLQMLGDPAENKVRTVQRWAAEERDIPGPIGALLNLLDAMRENAGIDTDCIRGWFARAAELAGDADGQAFRKAFVAALDQPE